jgi:hypothetical protein
MTIFDIFDVKIVLKIKKSIFLENDSELNKILSWLDFLIYNDDLDKKLVYIAKY